MHQPCEKQNTATDTGGTAGHSSTGGVRRPAAATASRGPQPAYKKLATQLRSVQPPSPPSPPLASHGISNALLRSLRLGTLRPDEKVFDVDTNSFLHAVEQPGQTDLQQARRNRGTSGENEKEAKGGRSTAMARWIG